MGEPIQPVPGDRYLSEGLIAALEQAEINVVGNVCSTTLVVGEDEVRAGLPGVDSKCTESARDTIRNVLPVITDQVPYYSSIVNTDWDAGFKRINGGWKKIHF